MFTRLFFFHCISKDDVIRAVKYLNPQKSEGASGVMSDSVIHGTNMLFEYITCLFNSMLRHGISPDKFLVSILIPIPKGHRVDTGNSSNYRAVALSSIYGKILDNIILSVQQEELKTSDLQFGYKSESSTIMTCSTMHGDRNNSIFYSMPFAYICIIHGHLQGIL